MKITNSNVSAIAIAMSDKYNKERNAKIKAAKSNKTFQKEVQRWTDYIEKMPDRLKKEFRNGRCGVTSDSIADYLFDEDQFGKYRSGSSFENEVRLAAIEAKDIADLKKKLNINF